MNLSKMYVYLSLLLLLMIVLSACGAPEAGTQPLEGTSAIVDSKVLEYKCVRTDLGGWSLRCTHDFGDYIEICHKASTNRNSQIGACYTLQKEGR